MKFCRDCKHVITAAAASSMGWGCKHPNNGGKVNPVDGSHEPLFSTCHAMRAGPAGCGTDGAWFEARETVDTRA